ncbi:hypothetical protein P7K49_006820 [Saguinus oedipus]|uniref:Uncharacterized protein n=1 Tax=Saguinus oedipus TaxID=9490 RepID=A0ABQ9W3J6_SAGOE|nr:hypothetical protein P7K49_006820 [Saguinus oedipus]
MSALTPVPAAHSREDPPAVTAERESLLTAANRPADQPSPPEREGKEAAREERAAAATSAGARGEPSPALVLGRSVPQAAVPVRPLALHLAHKARGPGGPFGGEPPPLPPPPPSPLPPLLRDSPAEIARQQAAAGPEEKRQPLPLPPKGNPWTKKPPQHLSPATTGPPSPPLETLETGCGQGRLQDLAARGGSLPSLTVGGGTSGSPRLMGARKG